MFIKQIRTASSLSWPINCINISERVALLGDPSGYLLFCVRNIMKENVCDICIPRNRTLIPHYFSIASSRCIAVFQWSIEIILFFVEGGSSSTNFSAMKISLSMIFNQSVSLVFRPHKLCFNDEVLQKLGRHPSPLPHDNISIT